MTLIADGRRTIENHLSLQCKMYMNNLEILELL